MNDTTSSFLVFLVGQSTLLLTVAWIGSLMLRKRPDRAHFLLVLGIVSAILTPFISLLAGWAGWGWFAKNTTGIHDIFAMHSAYFFGALLCGAVITASGLIGGIIGSRLLMYRAIPCNDPDTQQSLFDCAKKLDDQAFPILFWSDEIQTPTVWGWGLHPAILLPDALMLKLSAQQRDAIFLHELAHFIRFDHWYELVCRCAGLFLFWNPLYWLVLRKTRLTADQVCDRTVLSHGPLSHDDYAETLLQLAAGPTRLNHLLTLSRKETLMKRIRFILDDDTGTVNGIPPLRKGRFWTLGVLLAMGLFSLGLTLCQERESRAVAAENNAPKVVKFDPANGAKDLDPENVKQLSVTFDHDMNTGGFSWCGSGPTFPETTDKPKWIDNRTCVMPVKLDKEKNYRVGINAPSFKNFKSAEGVAVEPVLYEFSTVGAKIQNPPTVVKFDPANGAEDLDPANVKQLSVTFDQDMGTNSYSWCGSGPTFPETTDKPKWIDNRTCVLPVELERGKHYRVGINAPSFKGFQNTEGIPVTPVLYEFSTEGFGEVVLPEFPAYKNLQTDSKPIPAGLLTSIRDKRKAVQSATYAVESYRSIMQAPEKETSRFRFQGDKQWFADISEIMTSGQFQTGCDGKNEWFFSERPKNQTPKGMERIHYNIRPYEKLNDISLSFLDPFHLMDQPADASDETLRQAVEKQGWKYLGQGKCLGKNYELFGRETFRDDQHFKVEAKFELGVDPETGLPGFIRSARNSEMKMGEETHKSESEDLSLFTDVSVNPALTEADFLPDPADAKKKEATVLEKPEEGYDRFFVRIHDGADGRMSVRAGGQTGPKGMSSSGLN